MTPSGRAMTRTRRSSRTSPRRDDLLGVAAPRRDLSGRWARGEGREEGAAIRLVESEHVADGPAMLLGERDDVRGAHDALRARDDALAALEPRLAAPGPLPP